MLPGCYQGYVGLWRQLKKVVVTDGTGQSGYILVTCNQDVTRPGLACGASWEGNGYRLHLGEG